MEILDRITIHQKLFKNRHICLSNLINDNNQVNIIEILVFSNEFLPGIASRVLRMKQRSSRYHLDPPDNRPKTLHLPSA